ncbi:MAG: hypothetical protein ACREDL_04005 [Bradyrhizobium sp.]
MSALQIAEVTSPGPSTEDTHRCRNFYKLRQLERENWQSDPQLRDFDAHCAIREKQYADYEEFLERWEKRLIAFDAAVALKVANAMDEKISIFKSTMNRRLESFASSTRELLAAFIAEVENDPMFASAVKANPAWSAAIKELTTVCT